MSYIEFDINKHTTDLLGLYRYVAAKVHRHHFVGGWADLEIPRQVQCVANVQAVQPVYDVKFL